MAPAVASSDDPLPPGTMLGRYRITRTLGGAGVVRTYEAIHRGLERRVAVKVLSSLPVVQADARSRFFMEAEAASRVRHPNLVDVIEVVPDQPIGYVVMEMLEGEDLAQLLARDGQLPTDNAIDGLLPVAAAIAAAHERGVVHRALGPTNIFLARTADGFFRPKVMNLGLGNVGDRGAAAKTMALSGGPAEGHASSYLAPEQVRDPRAADARSDEYALGAILYECLTGRRAFEGENQFATLRIISAGACPAARSWRPDLPPRLDAVIAKAISLDPAARFPSVKQLALALLDFASPDGADSWRPFFTASPSPSPSSSSFPSFPPAAPPPPAPPLRLSAPPRASDNPPPPVAKPGGTMVLPDAPPPRRSAMRPPRASSRSSSLSSSDSSSHFTPRPTRQTGRRAHMAPAGRSRLLGVLAPALFLLLIAGAFVAADRWGVELWLQYLPPAMPGSSAGEEDQPPRAAPPHPPVVEPAPPVPAPPSPPPTAAPPRDTRAGGDNHARGEGKKDEKTSEKKGEKKSGARAAKVKRHHRRGRGHAIFAVPAEEDAPAAAPPPAESPPPEN